MRKVWKWILGIVLGLIVLAVLVGVGFALRGGFHAARAGLGFGRGWYQEGPGIMPFGGYGGHGRSGRYGGGPFGGGFGGFGGGAPGGFGRFGGGGGGKFGGGGATGHW